MFLSGEGPLPVDDVPLDPLGVERCLVRQKIYLNERIDNQLSWYAYKARSNKSVSRIFVVMIGTGYGLAILSAVGQLAFPVVGKTILWASEPLLVLAASLLGYAQAKRYSELSASYSLTALEIQKLKSQFEEVSNARELAEFVAEAESAFSREHTQWIARISHK
ncbi:SLATT domain-containing protein [Actibacterium lipolyticum]|uniref:SMODS and SLOG-associating 2TM effector domain-containing protein n=1 Tax=Actibacterium lipolyticum TaxID=1524263 RepID=A0A238L8A0_9RHOB|nr:SLATT domain-containing protein [Actibacterium lipolyticum]SMX51060.1 hypothetical protein COL8621_03590 [Actibacterium lipolyticum]